MYLAAGSIFNCRSRYATVNNIYIVKIRNDTIIPSKPFIKDLYLAFAAEGKQEMMFHLTN